MEAILSLALVLGVCGRVDPVGTWNCEYQIGGLKRTADLTITKDGDKIAGAMSWPDQKDEKIKDPQFKDGKLTFSVVRKFGGSTIPIEYTVTIDGDKFSGKGVSDFGGKKQEFEINGQREKK